MTATATAVPDASTRPRRRQWYHWLAIVPAIGMLGGVPFVNRVHPLVLGLPLLFAWLVAWVLVTSALMGCILLLDQSRATAGDTPATAHSPTTNR